ncbi:hypothetical protein P3T76_004621 [Phytophthora citrophthora]|uniref:Uncharacterized protein n=1 Tax=Phytophthora citrophthora TaxID=4793 RepID=A0AAD9GR75_9STRA|nr:hypothetical protein P3T76_004621 [Phytophthora citrophthora]
MQMMQRRAQYPAYARVLWTISLLVGIALILTFLCCALGADCADCCRILSQKPMPPMLEAAKVQEEKKKESKTDKPLLADLSSVSAAIHLQTGELGKLSASLDEKERTCSAAVRSQGILQS